MSTAPERLVYQSDIEDEILRLSGLLEQATGLFAEAAEKAAEAEADYRVAYANEYYYPHEPDGKIPEKLTEKIREALAIMNVEELLHRRLIAEAKRDSLTEKCRQLRSQLDAVRTLSANVRVQT